MAGSNQCFAGPTGFERGTLRSRVALFQNSAKVTARVLYSLVEEQAMPRPLLLIHGYSATGLDFTNLYWALVERKVEVELLNVGNYISLNND